VPVLCCAVLCCDLCDVLSHALVFRRYCAFLVDSEVTAPALCALATDILLERGELPVGEIGKLLQVRTHRTPHVLVCHTGVPDAVPVHCGVANPPR
jgi:hypothetical protein